MSNRRDLLKMGVAATVLPLKAAWAARTQAAPAASVSNARKEPVVLHKAIFDTRFAASRAFGERMTASGVATAATQGDITALWFDSLHAHWQKGPAAIAGLTARGPLFCLERLAWDHGMRVVFRAEHSLATAGTVQHEIEAAGVVPDDFRDAPQGDWVRVVSEVIVRYPRTGAPNGSLLVQTARAAMQVPEDEALYSWVIAPALGA